MVSFIVMVSIAMNKILVFHNGDWYTRYFINKSRQILDAHVVFYTSQVRNFVDDCSCVRILLLLPLIAKPFSKIFKYVVGRSNLQYLNHLLFDYACLIHLAINSDAKLCFCLSGMSYHTLHLAKKLNIKTIVHCGNSHINNQIYFSNVYEDPMDLSTFFVKRVHMEYCLADYLFVESNFVKNSLIEYGIESDKIRVFRPYFVSSYQYDESIESRRNCNTFCIVQLVKRKGIEFIFQIWEQLDVSIRINLIGNNDLTEKYPRLNQYPNINLTGYLDRQALNRMYLESSFFILPTYEDGGPRSLIEAMSYGLIPITSPNCIGADIIINEYNGFILPLNDLDAWIDIINKLARGHFDIGKLRKNAIETIKKEFGGQKDDYLFSQIRDEINK
jgi:glycosyltransferase involved in cell wall biosynthesis